MKFKVYRGNTKKQLDFDAKMKKRMAMDRPTITFQRICQLFVVLITVILIIKCLWDMQHG